jgi:DNA-binding NtrC family response regulator
MSEWAWHGRCALWTAVATMIAPEPLSIPRARPEPGFHGAVSQFKRHLIEVTLHQAGGNRTRAARELGLQRTYLLRLIRDLGVTAPPPPPPRRRALEGVR